MRIALRYLLLGLLIAAVIVDADGFLDPAYWILAVAAGVLLWLAWTMLAPFRPDREQARAQLAKIETDPDTQFRIHRIGAAYWLVNFPVIVWLFFWHRDFWEVVGIFITLIYSVYANLATDYGAMSSAMAAKGQQPPPEIPLEER